MEKLECVISMSERYRSNRSRALLTYQVWKSSVNLDKLWTLVTDEVREKFLNKENDTAPVIDTLALVSNFT